MSARVAPVWWPVLAVASPVLAPWLYFKDKRFKETRARVKDTNDARMEKAEKLDLPELESLALTPVVEWGASEGFAGDAGVSYLFTTDRGSMLFDIGFGAARPALMHNARKLGVTLEQVDALAISHLHADHIGGVKAQRRRRLNVPDPFMSTRTLPCYLPDEGAADGFAATVVRGPQPLAAGIASTGPLARALFLEGYTEEQALVARVKDKGLVVFTGCGHPTIEVILDMARRLSDEPLYAIGGGLHFPVSGGRIDIAGIRFQQILGTGKPVWQCITDEDLSRTIDFVNAAGPQKVFLSGHDSCDHALGRMQAELSAETTVLLPGVEYSL